MSTVYEWLMAGEAGATVEIFDRHLFACTLAVGLGSPERPLNEAVGLSRRQLADVLGRYFPAALWLLSDLPEDAGELAIEEEDLRALLLRHRASAREEEVWLAAIIARRSLELNHLWQDLGLHSRTDLSGLMRRHFPALAEKNNRDMKWKKFFYRSLCEDEGLRLCKSPNCDVCDDFKVCFGDERAGSLPYAAA
jgi:nitrogen fixation protein NifQ